MICSLLQSAKINEGTLYGCQQCLPMDTRQPCFFYFIFLECQIIGPKGTGYTTSRELCDKVDMTTKSELKLKKANSP